MLSVPLIIAKAQDLGLDSLGIVTADWSPVRTAWESSYRSWLDAGYQGSMAYLGQHAGLKFHPEALLPGARSVIVAGLNYFQPASWPQGRTLSGVQGRGRIARYAWGRDYHKTLKKRLQKLEVWLQEQVPGMRSRVFTDSGPLQERLAADGSGMVFTGRHTLVIHPEWGSWILLGLILTDQPWQPTGVLRGPAGDTPHPLGGCPSGCTRCLKICPTGALLAPHRMDASRCISYLTIEHRGTIPLELRPLMGDWLFGCDLCQEVCPFNIRASHTRMEDFTVHRAGSSLDLKEILGLEDQTVFTRRFAGSPLMRAGRDSLVRNACIAAANSGAKELLPMLKWLAEQDPAMIVREHAAWAVQILDP